MKLNTLLKCLRGEGEEWNTFRVKHILLVSFVAADKNNTICCGMCRFPDLCSHRSTIVHPKPEVDVCVKASYKNCALLGYYAFLTNVSGQSLGPFSPLKMRPIGCPERSVRNYHHSLRRSPEERSSQLLCAGSLQVM